MRDMTLNRSKVVFKLKDKVYRRSEGKGPVSNLGANSVVNNQYLVVTKSEIIRFKDKSPTNLCGSLQLPYAFVECLAEACPLQRLQHAIYNWSMINL